MIRTALFLALVLFAGCASRQLRPAAVVRVNVLPLALNDAFEFRKTTQFLNGGVLRKTNNAMLTARLRKINFGVIDAVDVAARQGNYFSFYWRASRRASLTVRLEYRTEKMGDYVQAREISYQNVRGTRRTDFEVIGDDYLDDGRITAWRAILIEDNQIVALEQSFLWN